MIRRCVLSLMLLPLAAAAQPLLPDAPRGELDEAYLPATRIVWQSGDGIRHAESLLGGSGGQATLSPTRPPVVLPSGSSVLLDFGRQINGGIDFVSVGFKGKQAIPVHVRFGESVSEALDGVAGKTSATNDHAMRDFATDIPWMGRKRVGGTGFRFVRIDVLGENRVLKLSSLRAYLRFRDVPYLGSFRCNDERLNTIWQTGAYTVHLNMQEYLWDGIKRDRLVWVGDLHPEVATVNAVFGANPVVPKSLDFIRDITPPTQWMNGISAYSMWWVIIHREWYQWHGDLDYLAAQKPYLKQLLPRLAGFVGPDGRETLDGHRFLDWPSSENQPAVHAGLQALLLWTLEDGARLMEVLDEPDVAATCRAAVRRLRGYIPFHGGSKQAAALMALRGMREPTATAHEILERGGAKGLSTFYGYYVLEAMARADRHEQALGMIRDFWGGMLDLGATTFWEDFNLEWTENASRIDELVPEGKKDIHADCGAYCYVGYRHSLCHGWAAGPTPWMTRHLLGFEPVEPGCSKVRIEPNLAGLDWVEGTVPTPLGVVHIRAKRITDGSTRTSIEMPEGMERVR